MLTRTTILAILLTCSMVSRGQVPPGAIDSAYVDPPNPGTNDSVSLIVESSFISTGCELDSVDISLQGTQLNVKAYYWRGFATTLCYRTDTIPLGILDTGAHMIVLQPCVYFQPAYDTLNNDTIYFAVTNIKENPTSHNTGLSVYPNPTTNHITIDVATPSGDQATLTAYRLTAHRLRHTE